MATSTAFEILGWSIIIFEIFGARSRLSASVDAVHSAMVRVAELVLHNKIVSLLVTLIVASLVLIMAYVLRPDDLYWRLEASLIERTIIAFDIYQHPHRLFALWSLSTLVVAVLFVPLLGLLRLMESHPEGVLASVGVILALGSSIAARI
ncbi:hypothetical protein [Primorskyibacter flagellatus]|uniref:hypothetical protein n=1 Tax=Primorskyibacter flagellatus TaxID=1387277 RepID=UPI00117BDE25|nr:hypothetical protein [Primorskyibacter flagellatus]